MSTLELFFDLVFVFSITQLTTLLVDDPSWRGAARAVLELGVLWWMYGGHAWLTNAVPPRSTRIRLLLMTGMAGFLGWRLPSRTPSVARACPSASAISS